MVSKIFLHIPFSSGSFLKNVSHQNKERKEGDLDAEISELTRKESTVPRRAVEGNPRTAVMKEAPTATRAERNRAMRLGAASGKMVLRKSLADKQSMCLNVVESDLHF